MATSESAPTISSFRDEKAPPLTARLRSAIATYVKHRDESYKLWSEVVDAYIEAADIETPAAEYETIVKNGANSTGSSASVDEMISYMEKAVSLAREPQRAFA